MAEKWEVQRRSHLQQCCPIEFSAVMEMVNIWTVWSCHHMWLSRTWNALATGNWIFKLNLNGHMWSLSWLVQIYSIWVQSCGLWDEGGGSLGEGIQAAAATYFHLCPQPQPSPVLSSSNDSGLWTFNSREKEGQWNFIPEACCLCNHLSFCNLLTYKV